MSRDHQLRDHLGIERGATPGHASQRVHELPDVGDTVLEQVADTTGSIRQQLGRVLVLDVLAEHEDRCPGDPAARLDRGPQALVTLGGRHPHVDHRDVGPVLDDGVHERRAISHLGDDLAPGIEDQPRQTLADQRGVLGDDHPQRLGIHPPMMHQRGCPGHAGMLLRHHGCACVAGARTRYAGGMRVTR